MLLHQAMGDYPGAYRAMEDALKAGKIRAIGVSNFYPERLVDVCALRRDSPLRCIRSETHPFRQQDAAHAVMERYGVAHESWAPFAEAKNGIFENSCAEGNRREARQDHRPGRAARASCRKTSS